jgi:hypothetical protein
MRNTLQEQYNLIKEGKGAKDVFLKHAKSLFPNLVPNHYEFDSASKILLQRGIISENMILNENLWGIATGNNKQPDWFKLFEEYTASSEEKDTKADASKTSKEVDEYKNKSYHNQYEAETGDDVIFDQYLHGIQIEACKSENNGKTVDELKKIVLKNLKKDKLYYTKNAAFNTEGIGYTEDAPGLGKTKEVKGKYASSGMEPVKLKEAVMYGSSDGDRDADIESSVQANEYYEKGLQAYSEGDLLKAEQYYNAALKAGAWLGWTEYDLPPYETMTKENMDIKESQLRTAIRQLIKEELNLKEIDQIGEEAAKGAKVKKINDEINKRKKKIKALETLKELEDDSINPKKLKELYSEIKKLESVKTKLEKKGKKKEQIVDEVTVVDKTTTSDEVADIVKQEKTTPAAVKKAIDTAKSTGEPVNVA